MAISGKTYSILSRLAHFYHAEEAGPLLLRFAELFGQRLEAAEADEYSVQRSHYIQRAANDGASGYTAPPALRGDIDKIFALYLEALGGTGPLVQTSPRVTSRSIDARRLAQRFSAPDALIAWLAAKFAASLLSDYAQNDATARQTLYDLVPGQATRDYLLSPHPGAPSIVIAALAKLLARFNVANLAFTPSDIPAAFPLALLLGETPIAVYVRGKLTPETAALLGAYNGGPRMNPALPAALAADLNTVILRDPGLYRRNAAAFPLPTLSATGIELVRSIYLDDFISQYTDTLDPSRREQLLDSLADVEPAPIPAGDDLARLNRILIAAAFSTLLPAVEVPSLNRIRDLFATFLNRLLTLPDLYRADLFPDFDDYPTLQRRFQNDPVWINRTLLESVLQPDLEKTYVPYRDRLLGLIQVLRNGASTRQGILDIVAANLGIVGNSPQARAARATIFIEEYNPRQASFFSGGLALFQEFTVSNSNVADATPEIWVTIPALPFGLANIRFADSTGHTVRAATRVKSGDILVFRGASLLLNTVLLPESPSGTIPALPPGQSKWRMEADLVAEGAVRPAGRFDATAFDVSAFAPDTAVARVDVLSYRNTPGEFKVVIPWHIPGFTDKFQDSADHPRNQILDLVNKVRAAGVTAHVAYRQSFAEDHAHSAKLAVNIRGGFLTETQQAADSLRISTNQRAREDHSIEDSLVLSAQFDATFFDSLNTFAG